MSRPFVDYTAFRRSHARHPRGRAVWAFGFLSADRKQIATEWFAGTFSDCRKKAVAKAADFPGCYCIEVLP